MNFLVLIMVIVPYGVTGVAEGGSIGGAWVMELWKLPVPFLQLFSKYKVVKMKRKKKQRTSGVVRYSS